MLVFDPTSSVMVFLQMFSVSGCYYKTVQAKLNQAKLACPRG